jgi:phenylalanyl-tRNA synthetase beta chain
MKFSEHWLRTLVDPPLDSAALAEAMTMAGLEVEERTPAAPPFRGVVVAKVLSVARHPHADRLSVCSVDAGRGAPLSIVCGAPNVSAGALVPCALIGAVVPGGLSIGKSTMRGVESQGMLCSASELGISDDASGLLLLDGNLRVGADLRDALDLDDQLFTLKLTPNRADCLSLLGIARDVGAITATAVTPPPRASIADASTITRDVRIEEPLACPRFSGRVIDGIDARAPTPAWMKQRLQRSGIRPISAVVDVTNYVMLELGQPLHAYDNAQLAGGIVVRFASEGEKLTLLNGQVIDLDPSLLLVADHAKPLGLAGIMGGEHSGIGDATRSMFLEGAFWNPVVIQGKARRLGFVTDAGYRFERGVDFAACPAAVDRASALIVELCGGRAGPLVDARGELPRRDPIRVRAARVARILGVGIPGAEVEAIFTRLGLKPQREGDDFIVTPPSYRFDLAIEADLIEEVARLYGYDRIEAGSSAHRQSMLPAPETARPVSALRERLVDRDYQEVITFSFVNSAWERALGADAPPVAVLNPIASDLDVMRTTLLGGLLDALRANVNRKAERVRIFETGRCFRHQHEHIDQPLFVAGLAYGPAEPPQWDGGKRAADLFDVKGDIEALAMPLSVSTHAAAHPALHPGRSARVLVGGRAAGWIGELHPRLARAFELPRPPVAFELALDALTTRGMPAARPVSKLPVVRRDLSVVVDDKVPAQDVLDALHRVKPPQIEHISLFDVYRGPGIEQGRKSLAILVLIQDTARTLTDAEIDGAVALLLRELENRFKATLRQ